MQQSIMPEVDSSDCGVNVLRLNFGLPAGLGFISKWRNKNNCTSHTDCEDE